ncbi:MAG: anti-sigma factor [Alphaproteobacteria bacterium]|nr:anti-sigma factor [Alphaproteobacteria bacterium]MBL7099907.1 anti-sigma factor [Alphaproteobacteria bacterium]
MDCTSKPLATADLPWMPLGPGIAVRPLRFAGDERTLQLKVEPGVTVGRHRHTGHVHAFNVSGRRRLGNGHVAYPGDYVYEPPHNEDCWSCEGDEPCIVQIAMSGRVEYLDNSDAVTGFTDTPGLKAQYLAWCHANGFTPTALGAL